MRRREFVGGMAAAVLTGAARGEFGGAGAGPVRVGQIGVGHGHAEGKMAVYRESPRYEVVGIAEPDDDLWEAVAGRGAYRGLRRMTVDELLGAPGLEAVAVETEVGDLLPAAHRVADAGLHLHLDKPPGDSLPEFRRLLEKMGAAGKVVQLGYMYRYNPAIEMLREILARGWLGEVFEVHAVMGKVLSASERAEVSRYDGGIMFELGCHVIDLVVEVLGVPDRVTPHVRASRDDGINDNMLAVFEYPSALATVRSAGVEVEGFGRRHLVVCGTEGTFHVQPLDRPSARIALDRERRSEDLSFVKGATEIPFEPPYRRYVGDAADLAAVIRGEKAFSFSPAHDLAVQEAVLRASGMPVE